MVSIISILEVLGLIVAAVCIESSRLHRPQSSHLGDTLTHLQKCPHRH